MAAWLATGLEREGDACTILGSTLAVKLLSAVRCEDAATGAYSQRLGRFWLTGESAPAAGGGTADVRICFCMPAPILCLGDLS